MGEAVLTEWLVADGAAVEEGVPLYAVETGKTVQEIEAAGSGVLRIKAAAGETYQVGDVIAEIE